MPTVNLSRIHTMQANLKNEISALKAPLLNSDYSETFAILESTTDQDYDDFLKAYAKLRAKYDGRAKLIRQKMAYLEYLRGIIDKANHETGVSERLLKLASLQREMGFLRELYGRLYNCHPAMAGSRKSVDYYKAAYTENSRVYNLTVYMYAQEDVDALQKEIAELEKRINGIGDEIAVLNQTRTVEIQDFDEFAAANFG